MLTFNTSAAFTRIETMPNRDFVLPELAKSPPEFIPETDPLPPRPPKPDDDDKDKKPNKTECK